MGIRAFPVVLAMAFAASGCAGVQDRNATPVTVAQLVNHPFDYDGKRVRVRGYLLADNALYLLNPTETDCYLWTDDRMGVTTTLPWSAMGGALPAQPDVRRWRHDGHLVEVVGVFAPSSKWGLWGPSPCSRHPEEDCTVLEDPEWKVVGPLKWARLAAVEPTTCRFRSRTP